MEKTVTFACAGKQLLLEDYTGSWHRPDADLSDCPDDSQTPLRDASSIEAQIPYTALRHELEDLMRFILCCLLAACTSSGDPIDTSMDTDTEVPAEPVAASIQL